MGKRGRKVNLRLAKVCARVGKSEYELAHALGLSRAALKSIERPDAPLYLKLALTALLDGLEPDPVFRSTDENIFQQDDVSQIRLAG